VADLSDVEETLKALLGGVIYPNGTGQPSVVLNDAGQPAAVRVLRGWPIAANLDADLAAGKGNVSIFSRGGAERNVTKYNPDFQDLSRQTATIAAAVADNKVTLSGSINPAITQYVTLQIGPRVVVSYQPLAGDTLATVATALAGQIAATFAPASAVGAVITVSSSAAIRATVGTIGQQIAEIRRQITMIQITLWCPGPKMRDSIAKAVEPILADTPFLTLPDQSAARVRYMNTLVSDSAEKVALYRRDLIYTVEYATTKTDTAFAVTSIGTDIRGGQVELGTAQHNKFYAPTPD
jgi:hypothetical protein